MIKSILKKIASKTGDVIQRITKDEKENLFTMEQALMRCVNRGIEINTVVDVGASDGRWARMCIKYLPNAQYLLIEAQEEHRKGLDIFKDQEKMLIIYWQQLRKMRALFFLIMMIYLAGWLLKNHLLIIV